MFPAAAGCGPRLDWRHENQNPVNKTHPAGTEVWDPVTAGKPSRTAEIHPLVSPLGMSGVGDGMGGTRGGVQVRPGTNFPENRTPDQSNQGENTSFSGLTINPAPFIGPNSVKIPRRLLSRQSRSESDQESWRIPGSGYATTVMLSTKGRQEGADPVGTPGNERLRLRDCLRISAGRLRSVSAANSGDVSRDWICACCRTRATTLSPPPESFSRRRSRCFFGSV